VADTPDITGIFAGIETRLATISGLHADSEMPGNVYPPAAWPDLTSLSIEYDLDMGGSMALSFNVRLALPVAGPGLVRAQAALLPYLAVTGDQSIKAAIEGDRTLGGKCQTLKVNGAQGIEDWEYGKTACLVCDFPMTVWP
jgi:hypothetical protein